VLAGVAVAVEEPFKKIAYLPVVKLVIATFPV
jgi:hypothetical protein